MRFAERDAQRRIIATYANSQPGRALEALPDDDPEIVAFESRDVTADLRLASLDVRALRAMRELVLDSVGARQLSGPDRARAIEALRDADDEAAAVRARR